MSASHFVAPSFNDLHMFVSEDMRALVDRSFEEGAIKEIRYHPQFHYQFEVKIKGDAFAQFTSDEALGIFLSSLQGGKAISHRATNQGANNQVNNEDRLYERDLEGVKLNNFFEQAAEEFNADEKEISTTVIELLNFAVDQYGHYDEIYLNPLMKRMREYIESNDILLTAQDVVELFKELDIGRVEKRPPKGHRSTDRPYSVLIFTEGHPLVEEAYQQ